MRRFVLFWLVGTVAFAGLSGQERFPQDGILFDNNSVARVDITIDPDSLDVILQPGNEQSDHEFPALFTFSRGAYSTTIEPVGFRLRGNTSRYSGKKSFKVSFNTFVAGQKFAGIEKMNLNGEHNDPSVSRAHICWHVFREAGVPASRSGHVELYINDEYRGLYLNVEHIDEEFARIRFGNGNGQMYKCLWPADLLYLGDDPELYKFEHDGRRAYELKRSDGNGDYSDLAGFIDVLNNTDPSDYPEKLEPVFNVNGYLKNLAVEILTGHWDAYSYNKNNYYLYNNKANGKMEFIPYDPDNTLGISWWDIDWTSEYIYTWFTSAGERPLTARLLQNTVYRDRFSFYMDRLLSEVFNSAMLNPFIDATKSSIAPFAATDVYRTYDYGYDLDAFNNAFDQAAGNHVKEGIKPFISKRHTSAAQQVVVNEISPAITLLHVNEPTYYENLVVQVLIEDESTPVSTMLFFSTGDGYTPLTLTSVGNDEYVASVPGLTGPGTVNFYLEAEDNQSNLSRDPVAGTYSYTYGGPVGIQTAVESPCVFTVYPNPVTREIRFSSPTDIPFTSYCLFSYTGQLLLKGNISGARNGRIRLGDVVGPGWYILELTGTDGQSHRAKVMVSR